MLLVILLLLLFILRECIFSVQEWSPCAGVQNRLRQEALSVSYWPTYNDDISLHSYCGPDPPRFEKSDFQAGKVLWYAMNYLYLLLQQRWLILFNNTGNDGSFSPKIGIESPTIGYRSKAGHTYIAFKTYPLRKCSLWPAVLWRKMQ